MLGGAEGLVSRSKFARDYRFIGLTGLPCPRPDSSLCQRKERAIDQDIEPTTGPWILDRSGSTRPRTLYASMPFFVHVRSVDCHATLCIRICKSITFEHLRGRSPLKLWLCSFVIYLPFEFLKYVSKFENCVVKGFF